MSAKRRGADWLDPNDLADSEEDDRPKGKKGKKSPAAGLAQQGAEKPARTRPTNNQLL